MAYGIEFYNEDGDLQMFDARNSRVIHMGQGSPPNPTNDAILLNLDSFGWPFHRTKGIVLCRCAPVKYEFDNYTSTADLTNSLDINHPPGTQSTENGTKFNMTHILSQATDYDDTYLRVDHGDDIDCDDDESSLAWEDARADFAPIIIYYG